MMAVLGVQLILAIVLWSSGSDYTAFKAKEPLLAFDAAKVDQIEIGESGASSVELTKQDGKWTVPSLLGFPADEAKVSGLLTKIAGLKKGWPVASSAEAAKRFKVTDAAHERLITLKSGGKESGKLFIGTSPAFKQAHARAGTGKNIYSVAFATYDAGVRGEDWMDRQAPTDVVLTPAACYPLYPMIARRGTLAPQGALFDLKSYCFRHEPSKVLQEVCVACSDHSFLWHFVACGSETPCAAADGSNAASDEHDQSKVRQRLPLELSKRGGPSPKALGENSCLECVPPVDPALPSRSCVHARVRVRLPRCETGGTLTAVGLVRNCRRPKMFPSCCLR